MSDSTAPSTPAPTPPAPLRPATPRISATVITRNEADRLAPCLQSLAFCDEIIVVDSLSDDGTAALARAHGAQVIERPFRGYREQKQFAVEQARHDWVLCLDADERISTALRGEIERARAAGFAGAAGYAMPRCTEYFGRMIRHGNWYPDRKLRLFDRRRGRWGGREVHERVEVDGPVRRFAGEIEHFAYRDLGDQQRRLSRYARMMAEQMHAEGRRAGIRHLLVNPLWRFVRGYVLRAGFLDGWRGFAIAALDAHYVFDKFLRLWLLQHGARAGAAWGDH